MERKSELEELVQARNRAVRSEKRREREKKTDGIARARADTRRRRKQRRKRLGETGDM